MSYCHSSSDSLSFSALFGSRKDHFGGMQTKLNFSESLRQKINTRKIILSKLSDINNFCSQVQTMSSFPREVIGLMKMRRFFGHLNSGMSLNWSKNPGNVI